MSKAITRRGRPKGSGIDDEVVLSRVAKLMADDPALNPTSAIRKAGIGNPSALRRLRDKLKSKPPERRRQKQKKERAVSGRQPAALAAKAAANPASLKKSEAPKPAATASKLTRNLPPAKVQQRSAAGLQATQPFSSERIGNAVPRRKSRQNGLQDVSNAWLRLGFDMASAMVHAQIALYDQMLRSTPLPLILRQQSYLADQWLAATRTQHEAWTRPDPRD